MAQPTHVFPDVWTESDLDSLPDDGHRYEILDGSLHMTPPPDGYHQSIAAELLALLRAAAPPGWHALAEIGVRVPGGNFVPDIAVLTPQADRALTWQRPEHVALVVEITSQSTDAYDKTTKALKYAEAGIPSYWRVARDGTVTVYALVDAAQYGIVATVRPGATGTVSLPFPVELNPDSLIV